MRKTILLGKSKFFDNFIATKLILNAIHKHFFDKWIAEKFNCILTYIQTNTIHEYWTFFSIYMVIYTVCILGNSFIVHLLINSRFPKDEKKRRLWMRPLNRDDFVPTDRSCVCSEHSILVGIMMIPRMRIIFPQ